MGSMVQLRAKRLCPNNPVTMSLTRLWFEAGGPSRRTNFFFQGNSQIRQRHGYSHPVVVGNGQGQIGSDDSALRVDPFTGKCWLDARLWRCVRVNHVRAAAAEEMSEGPHVPIRSPPA